jgi:hypothetical protein
MHHVSYTLNVRHGGGCGWGGFPAKGGATCPTSIERAACNNLVRIAHRIAEESSHVPRFFSNPTVGLQQKIFSILRDSVQSES